MVIAATCLAVTGAKAAPRADLAVVLGGPPEILASARTAGRDLGIAVIDATPAPDPAAPSAAPALVAGVTAYEALRFEEAEAALDRAVASAAASGGASLSSAQLSDIFLYRGLARRQLGRGDASWDDFIAAATLAPARVLDPARFPPRDADAYANAREAVGKLPTGTLSVTAPTGCAVVIDGSPGASAVVAHGRHFVAAACGAHAWGTAVTVARPTVELAVPPAPVADDATVLVQARAASANAVVAIAPAGPVIALRLLAIDGHELSRASARTPAEVGDALRSLVSPAVVVVAKPTPWYRKNWVWAVGGALAVAAITIPLLATQGGDDTLHVRVPL